MRVSYSESTGQVQYLVKHHSFTEAGVAASRCLLSGPLNPKKWNDPLPFQTQTSLLHHRLSAVTMNNQAYYELYRRSRYHTDDTMPSPNHSQLTPLSPTASASPSPIRSTTSSTKAASSLSWP